jgi:hypothetical protein
LRARAASGYSAAVFRDPTAMRLFEPDEARWRLPTALLLAALMFGTRQFEFGPLPDASWAVFFLGGLYLGGTRPFALFLAAAVLIDYVATEHLGVSAYCLSRAYVFLPLAYATLWLGGVWSARHRQAGRPLRGWALTAASLVLSVSACYLISNGTFYWLGGRVATPTLAAWSVNLGDWYGYFLAVPSIYAATVMLLRELAVRPLRRWDEDARRLSGPQAVPPTAGPRVSGAG